MEGAGAGGSPPREPGRPLSQCTSGFKVSCTASAAGPARGLGLAPAFLRWSLLSASRPAPSVRCPPAAERGHRRTGRRRPRPRAPGLPLILCVSPEPLSGHQPLLPSLSSHATLAKPGPRAPTEVAPWTVPPQPETLATLNGGGGTLSPGVPPPSASLAGLPWLTAES